MATEIIPPPPDAPADDKGAIPPPPAEGALEHVGRIVREEAGKVPGKVAEDVKGVVEGIKNPKMSTVLPLTVGPGAGVVSRVGSIAMGRMLDEPKTTAAGNVATAAKAIGTAAIWEAVFGIAPKIHGLGVPSLETLAGRLSEKVKAAADRRAAFEWATEAPMKAYEAIKDRIPPGKWMFVPTISPNRITAKEAAEGLAKLKGPDYDAARQEIVQELNILDSRRVGHPELGRKGPRPYAGTGFAARTAKERFDPKAQEPATGAETAATKVTEAAKTPAVRAAADVGATEEKYGVPVGMIPFMRAGSGFGDIARSIRSIPH